MCLIRFVMELFFICQILLHLLKKTAGQGEIRRYHRQEIAVFRRVFVKQKCLINKTPIKEFETGNVAQCMEGCISTLGCLSFNFLHPKCSLFDEDRLTLTEQDFAPITNCNYQF